MEVPGRVTTYKEVDAALRNDDLVQAAHAESQEFYADTLLLLHGGAHFRRRRLEAPLFDRKALLRYERGHLSQAVHRCLAERGEAFDLVGLMEDILLQVAAALTGIDGIDTPRTTERFKAIVADLADAAHVEWSTGDHDAVLRRGAAVKATYVEEFFTPSLIRRKELHRAGDPLPEDLIATVVAADGLAPDPDVLVRESILYLMASTQTTTHALPHVMAELDHWIDTHPNRRDDLTDISFLQRAAAEALRLHPPVPALMRRAVRDTTLTPGHVVAAGEQVALDLFAANTDPVVFGADADTFEPDRELAAAVKPYGMSFGGGIHSCIGRSLAAGLMSTPDDPDAQRPIGMVALSLRALLHAGVIPDPDAPAVRSARSAQGYYESFPVRRRANVPL